MKHVVGVDISQGSVDVYNQEAKERGLASEIKAVCANLRGEPGELDDARFDLITVRRLLASSQIHGLILSPCYLV